jgi:hypothetical protein
MASWASKSMNAVLRVVLTALLVFVAVKVGIMFAPRLARLGAGHGTMPGTLSAVGGTAQPDWGGGHLSVSARSATGAIDSVKMSSGGDRSKAQTYSSSAAGVMLRQNSDSDYAITMAVPSPSKPGRTAVFDVPSSSHFRKELLPAQGDAEAPAADIPLYPQSSCRMQVGRGTACFVGFYLTPDSVEAVRSFYVRALTQLGWERVAAGGAGYLETFTKRKEDRTVAVQLRKQDAMTTRIGLVVTTPGSPDRSERK